MFTGIVSATGKIDKVSSQVEGIRCFVKTGNRFLADNGIGPGDSVAVDGVCLTVTELEEDGYWTDISSETLEKTTLSKTMEGRGVNLESSLAVGDSLGGHFVFGHVDCTASITELKERGDYFDLKVDIPGEYRKFLAPKGSVALDGISLTVNEVKNGEISIRIVPHTFTHTTLSDKTTGDHMNLEVDMLSRYVYNHLFGIEGSEGSLTFSDLKNAGMCD